MARMKQGILGGLSGKIANVVGSSWKGISVLKSLPLSVANPRTAAQTNNRGQFSQCVAFASTILSTVIKPLLDRIAVQMSGYNLFMQLNKALFNLVGLPDGANLVISQGTVTPVADLAASKITGYTQLQITWTDNTGVGDALATDELYIACYDTENNLSYGFAAAATRDAETVTVDLPADLQGNYDMYVWAAFRKADGTRASNTEYTLSAEV